VGISACLLSEGHGSSGIVYQTCLVDPFNECLDLLLYSFLPVLIARITLMAYYLKSQQRGIIQQKVIEAFFVLQTF
jgi:hypothetical protein